MLNDQIERDKKLVESAIDGDEISFQEIYRHYAQYIYNRAFYCKMEAEFAEDIVQETFSTFYFKMKTFDTSKPLEKFLGGIADNIILSYRRKNPKMERMDVVEEKQTKASQENEMINTEKSKMISEKMNMLDTEIRKTLLMHVKEGKSFNEIAQILDIPVGTVKSRISRGTDRLRNLLEGLID